STPTTSAMSSGARTAPRLACCSFSLHDALPILRMTTRYNENDFLASLFSMIHETGHALYEQGLDGRFFGTPLCDTASLGMHESRSEEHTSELQSPCNLVCRLLLEKKNKTIIKIH